MPTQDISVEGSLHVFIELRNSQRIYKCIPELSLLTQGNINVLHQTLSLVASIGNISSKHEYRIYSAIR